MSRWVVQPSDFDSKVGELMSDQEFHKNRTNDENCSERRHPRSEVDAEEAQQDIEGRHQ